MFWEGVRVMNRYIIYILTCAPLPFCTSSCPHLCPSPLISRLPLLPPTHPLNPSTLPFIFSFLLSLPLHPSQLPFSSLFSSFPSSHPFTFPFSSLSSSSFPSHRFSYPLPSLPPLSSHSIFFFIFPLYPPPHPFPFLSSSSLPFTLSLTNH